MVACIVGCGCSSTQNAQSSVQNTPSASTTTSQPLSPAPAPVTAGITLKPTTAQTTFITTTETPKIDLLTVTLNSAVKKITIGGSNPFPGNIFLVLDVVIQNNDKNQGFTYSDSSFSIFDKINKRRITAITYKIPNGLNNPLTSGIIPIKSKQSGQIVFGVLDNSSSYKFSIVDSTGTVLTSVDNINVA
jgi:hypothetical protein